MSALLLADCKNHLNITGDIFDDELQKFIDRAEAAIGRKVGPLEPEPVTQVVNSVTGSTLLLSRTPVASVTSITSLFNGAVSTLTGLDVRAGSGVLAYYLGAPGFYLGPYSVVYEAGWEDVPADLLLAVAELVRHFWETQRGGASTDKPGSFPTSAAPTGMGYAFPNRVEELLSPYRTPGFA